MKFSYDVVPMIMKPISPKGKTTGFSSNQAIS